MFQEKIFHKRSTQFQNQETIEDMSIPRMMIGPETEKATIESNGTNTDKEEEISIKIHGNIKMAKIIGRF